ncbi:hypothetical protein ABVV53_17065 [Novosphingobium sp. RD2P27]|uniref:Uncharacterized protein n=1 Tax=Novosphingobium kalidii TaxID=3230299 RepID=A0ABV2D5Z8_9SPHN
MDMLFDLENTATGQFQRAKVQLTGHPSWLELLSRMIASREASVSLAKEMQPVSSIGQGSFAGSAAPLVAAHSKSKGSVNPTDLGNCKSSEATTSQAAGRTISGGRGYI